MAEITFGEITGVPVGATYPDRKTLRESGLHRPLQAGIAGRGAEGAESIVLNEGYEDDEDDGDEVVYTGEGGRDPNTGRQVADQRLIKGNRALRVNQTEGLPVRVIRGSKVKPHGPARGYRYDGLYVVEDSWHARGRAGFLVWRFRLRRSAGQVPLRSGATMDTAPRGVSQPDRRRATVQRIVRSTDVTNHVKRVHDYCCQVCGTRLETPTGPYAEGAHIRPLGRPHNGPDVPDNVLCLCPNCHVLFDTGAIIVEDDFRVRGRATLLRRAAKHPIDANSLKYHREHYGRL
jgi:putative restriction endonuclease